MLLEFGENVAEHLFNLLLMKSINVKESLSTSNGRYVKNNPKMTGISTVKFMDNPIAVYHDELRPVFRMG
jgi:hypothetical protein